MESFVIFSSAAESRLAIAVSAAGRLRPRVTLLDNSSLRAETQPLNSEPGGPRENFSERGKLGKLATPKCKTQKTSEGDSTLHGFVGVSAK